VLMGKDGAGKMALTATGKLNEGLATSADMEAFGVHSQFSGRIEASADKGPKATGRLGVLIENTDQLFGVVGLHRGDASPIGKVFSGEGEVGVDRHSFDLKNIRGTVAGTSFSGSFNLGFDNSQPTLKMDMQAGRLSLPFALGTALLGRDGSRYSAATRFSPQALAGLKADIKIKADKFDLWPAYEVKDGEFSLIGDKETLKIAVGGNSLSGKKIEFKLDANVGAQLTRVSGKVSGAVLMRDLLATDASAEVMAGSVFVAGEFAGSGRTPGGLLAALSGKGVYEISQGVAKNISPERFAQKLTEAETAKDIEVMIATRLRAGDMKFGDGKGSIKLESGVANFSPLTIRGPGAHGSLRAIYEIGNGLADVSMRLKLDNADEVPGFEIAYAGPPDKLAPSSDFAALKSHLTVAALNRTLDKLEALEEEQRRLVEEEKKARAEAEAKRKKQQEKQRLLREKQRRLLEEATRKKQEAVKKKVLEAARKKELEAARKKELEAVRKKKLEAARKKKLQAQQKIRNEQTLPRSQMVPPPVIFVPPPPKVVLPAQIPPPPVSAAPLPEIQVKELPPLARKKPVDLSPVQPEQAKKKPRRPKLGYREQRQVGVDR